MAPAAARLLAEIERSGSGSASFWALYWELLDQLTGDELRRVLTAAGRRTLLTPIGIRFPSAGMPQPPAISGAVGRANT